MTNFTQHAYSIDLLYRLLQDASSMGAFTISPLSYKVAIGLVSDIYPFNLSPENVDSLFSTLLGPGVLGSALSFNNDILTLAWDMVPLKGANTFLIPFYDLYEGNLYSFTFKPFSNFTLAGQIADSNLLKFSSINPDIYNQNCLLSYEFLYSIFKIKNQIISNSYLLVDNLSELFKNSNFHLNYIGNNFKATIFGHAFVSPFEVIKVDSIRFSVYNKSIELLVQIMNLERISYSYSFFNESKTFITNISVLTDLKSGVTEFPTLMGQYNFSSSTNLSVNLSISDLSDNLRNVSISPTLRMNFLNNDGARFALELGTPLDFKFNPSQHNHESSAKLVFSLTFEK